MTKKTPWSDLTVTAGADACLLCSNGERHFAVQAFRLQCHKHAHLLIPCHHNPPAHSRLTARPVTMTRLTQQQAAVVLGYTQVSWDNASGKEAQPASASKKWANLTTAEKSAATVLGYTEQTWSPVSVTKKTPWSDLSVTTGEDVCSLHTSWYYRRL